MNINFVIPDELHAWAKAQSQIRNLSLTAYLRGLIVKDRAQLSIATPAPPRPVVSPLDVIRPVQPTARASKPIDPPSFEEESVQV